jgi:hypothetical protein
MVAFVLIVILNHGVIMQDFSSEEACYEASKVILGSKATGVPVKLTTCVKK